VVMQGGRMPEAVLSAEEEGCVLVQAAPILPALKSLRTQPSSPAHLSPSRGWGRRHMTGSVGETVARHREAADIPRQLAFVVRSTRRPPPRRRRRFTTGSPSRRHSLDSLCHGLDPLLDHGAACGPIVGRRRS
jgi:hypothetical protein